MRWKPGKGLRMVKGIACKVAGMGPLYGKRPHPLCGKRSIV